MRLLGSTDKVNGQQTTDNGCEAPQGGNESIAQRQSDLGSEALGVVRSVHTVCAFRKVVHPSPFTFPRCPLTVVH